MGESIPPRSIDPLTPIFAGILNPPLLKMSYQGWPFASSQGYLVLMFGTRDAEFFVESLLKISSKEVNLIVGVHTQLSNAFFVNRPSAPNTLPDVVVGNCPLWILDFRPTGTVIPQKIWSPPNQSDWRRYVEQAQLRMPIFFIQKNGMVGLPLTSASKGDTSSLRFGERPAPLGGGHSTQIRIAWPGYDSWERQIQIRDQTRERKEITLERYAKLVAGVVDRFMTYSCNSPSRHPQWSVGPTGITQHNIIVVGTVQVSAGGWMPILQLAPPQVSPSSNYYYYPA
ncbi:hypothetical protein BC834DRAFT_966549 [Gloeopeniophorella convolvens]|nr:hypothetical protein BC834DRAFT_966549 [Gloeopeniophorella convolvens]